MKKTPRVFKAKTIGEMDSATKRRCLAAMAAIGEAGRKTGPAPSRASAAATKRAGLFGSKGKEPWGFTEHQFGFVPFAAEVPAERTIINAANLVPDPTLTRVDIRLDRLRVFRYPGSGRHFVMVTFVANNTVAGAGGRVENVTFSQTYLAQEGQGAGVAGYPIFTGLSVGGQGAAFTCATVNVKNESDQKALKFLGSGPVTQGLSLLTTAQPAIAPFVQIAKGFAEMFLTRNENVSVQSFFLGLDFDHGAAMGGRLAEGNYIAVQAPDEGFTWDDWILRSSDSRIVAKADGKPVPFNYISFRVSRSRT